MNAAKIWAQEKKITKLPISEIIYEEISKIGLLYFLIKICIFFIFIFESNFSILSLIVSRKNLSKYLRYQLTVHFNNDKIKNRVIILHILLKTDLSWKVDCKKKV